MNEMPKNKKEVSTEDILEELKKLRSESLIKDVLLALVPLLIAGLSIYFSYTNTAKQIEFSNTQLNQTREIENAKLLESFSQSILNGGEEAELARIALNSVRLTKDQRKQLSAFYETAAGGSDRPHNQPSEPPVSRTGVDRVFEELLSQLFSADREIRKDAYPLTKNYFNSNNAMNLIDHMITKVYSNPFNIKGRSNVLAILASLPVGVLAGSKEQLLSFFVEIESKGSINPAYAVGPQTKGWISEIREKIT